MNSSNGNAGEGARRNCRASFVVLALLALAAVLGACAAAEVTPGEAARPGPDDALVVLSITHSGARGFDLLLRLKKAGGGDRAILLPARARSRDWLGAPGPGPTPEQQPEGRLLVLRLKPGAYRLDYWNGVAEIGGLHGIGYEIFSDPFQVTFEARPGQLTYAGNVHLALPERLNYMARQTPSTYRLVLADRRQRDLERLQARHPGTEAGTVQVRLAQSPQAGAELRYYIVNFSDSDEPPTTF